MSVDFSIRFWVFIQLFVLSMRVSLLFHTIDHHHLLHSLGLSDWHDLKRWKCRFVWWTIQAWTISLQIPMNYSSINAIQCAIDAHKYFIMKIKRMIIGRRNRYSMRKKGTKNGRVVWLWIELFAVAVDVAVVAFNSACQNKNFRKEFRSKSQYILLKYVCAYDMWHRMHMGRERESNNVNWTQSKRVRQTKESRTSHSHVQIHNRNTCANTRRRT